MLLLTLVLPIFTQSKMVLIKVKLLPLFSGESTMTPLFQTSLHTFLDTHSPPPTKLALFTPLQTTLILLFQFLLIWMIHYRLLNPRHNLKKSLKLHPLFILWPIFKSILPNLYLLLRNPLLTSYSSTLTYNPSHPTSLSNFWDAGLLLITNSLYKLD